MSFEEEYAYRSGVNHAQSGAPREAPDFGAVFTALSSEFWRKIMGDAWLRGYDSVPGGLTRPQ